MKELAFRLTSGDDLRLSIEEYCAHYDVDTAVVLSAVGSLFNVGIRLADAQKFLRVERDYEIVSLTGTISRSKAHLHISLSDENGDCIGGHLIEGCLVNTTCEVVLGILEDYKSIRKYDDYTGYDEINFQEVEND